MLVLHPQLAERSHKQSIAPVLVESMQVFFGKDGIHCHPIDVNLNPHAMSFEIQVVAAEQEADAAIRALESSKHEVACLYTRNQSD